MHNIVITAENGNSLNPLAEIAKRALHDRMRDGHEGWLRIIRDCQQTPRLYSREENRFIADVKSRCLDGRPIRGGTAGALEALAHRAVNARLGLPL